MKIVPFLLSTVLCKHTCYNCLHHYTDIIIYQTVCDVFTYEHFIFFYNQLTDSGKVVTFVLPCVKLCTVKSIDSISY